MEEEIKKCWVGASFNTGDQGSKDPKRYTALQSLEERYKRFSIFGLIYAFLCPLLLVKLLPKWSNISQLSLSLFLAYTFIYFFAASLIDRWLAKGISKINLTEMTVSEVCKRAYYYRKKHLQAVMVLLPMAIVLVGWMILILADTKYFVYGVFSGIGIGSVVGIINFRKFMQEYKDITAE